MYLWMHKRSRGIALPIHDLGTKWGGWSMPCPGCLTLRKEPQYQPNRMLGWPWKPVWTGMENLAPPPGFKPRPIQLVKRRYTDYAILASRNCNDRAKMTGIYLVTIWKAKYKGISVILYGIYTWHINLL